VFTFTELASKAFVIAGFSSGVCVQELFIGFTWKMSKTMGKSLGSEFSVVEK
jgi:hypothetical protein